MGTGIWIRATPTRLYTTSCIDDLRESADRGSLVTIVCGTRRPTLSANRNWLILNAADLSALGEFTKRAGVHHSKLSQNARHSSSIKSARRASFSPDWEGGVGLRHQMVFTCSKSIDVPSSPASTDLPVSFGEMVSLNSRVSAQRSIQATDSPRPFAVVHTALACMSRAGATTNNRVVRTLFAQSVT